MQKSILRARITGRTKRTGRAIAPPLFAAAAIIGLASCGGGSDAVATVAEENAASLEATSDVRDFELLSVHDGSVTSLRDTVDGDRPVLLWFWAPH